jgi:general secretion pathway protein J
MTTGEGSDRSAGFTLLEAVVATALMAMILAALATITRQWLPNWNRGMVRVQGSEQIALGLDRLAADFAAAEFVSAGAHTRRPVFEGTERSVTFVRTSFGPNAGVGLDLIRIAEIDTERGPALVRTRTPFLPNVRSVPTFDPVVLVRMPRRLTFSYAGEGQSWQPSWQARLQLPAAIKLTLNDSNRATALTTTAAIHARLPIDCLTAQSIANCLASPLPMDKLPDAGKSTF